MKVSTSASLFIVFAILAVLLLDIQPSEDRQVISLWRAQHSFLKAERRNDARSGRAGDDPNLDHYIIPRTWNADKSISQGLHEAISLRNEQLAIRKQALGTNWTFAGPSNIGGRVRVVEYHPTNPDILYAGSASGGLFKSTNGGASWRAITDYLPTLAIGHLAFDPVDPDILYIGTGEGSMNWDKVYGDGLYRTTDGGVTWQNLMKGLVRDIDLAINKVVVHPDNPEMIFVAATFGGGTGAVFRSTDKGENWQAVVNGPARDVIIDPYQKNRILVGFGNYNGRSTNGLYYSDSMGTRFTFHKITTNLPSPDSIGRVVLDASVSQPGLMMCAMSRAPKFAPKPSEDFLGVFRSTDHGMSWEKLPSSTQSNMNEVLRGQGDYNLHIKIHPTVPTVVFLGGIEWWRSANSGDSFSRITNRDGTTNSSWVDMHYISFHPTNPRTMVMSSDGGVFRTKDCLTPSVVCEELNTGLACMQFYSMNYDRQNTSRVAGGTQDRRNNLGNSNQPDNWQRLSWGGDGGYVAFDYTDPNTFYITSQYGYLAKTTNGGGRFSSVISGLTRTDAQGNYMFSFVTPFKMHPTNPQILLLGGKRLHRTVNGMQSWTTISDDLTGATHSLSQIQDLSICTADPNVVYMVTGYSARAWKTTNALANAGDVTCTRIDAGLPLLYLGEITAHPFNPDIVYVGTAAFSANSGVYKSTDGGATWRHMKGSSEARSLPPIPVGAIAIWEKHPEVVFVGTDIGVYISEDGGENWSPYGSGLPNVVIDDLKITHDDILYAATHGRAMWMTSVVVSTQDIPKPLIIDLGQNYPNPFNPGTVIPFSLSQAGHARIELYDSRGRLVRTLIDERREAGEHHITLSMDGLPGGVYLYQLVSGKHKQSRKLMLLR